MYLKDFTIQLGIFRSKFQFEGKIICFVAKTVLEKTNVLMPSIIYPTEKQPLAVQNIKHGENSFVDAEFIKNEKRTSRL
jgi:hypothetical protein